ncbi:hypothetical protein CAOG_03172 [Capsaspora owczarzaki ATCC 30864]|uniref:hypothetical protein n=1 Tax=Capsaspora owczarzaki (strain ATCC 30864) TaxID=595528 RepID=UPI0001FE6EAD|nr:hypothetical protein CAOG_03172 [Capsaspora owczarzaki ATCC 30864]|eukprot:XP_004364011.1 hypothetical protein CAOG_03172 [Capsaspora owczarzaki ATCC 30864]
MQLLDRLTAVVMAALDRLMNRLGDILDPVIRWCGPLMVALAAALIVTIPSGYTWVIAPNTVLKFSQTTHDNDDFFWSAWLGWLAHWLLLLWAMPNLVFNFAMSVGVSPGRVSAVAMSSSASSASSYIAQTDLNSSATACVGHHNHVYFVLFLAYVTIACSYICAASSGPFMVCFDSPNPPEYPDNARGIVLYTFSASFAVAVAVGALFVWQLYLVSTAQTTIEYHRNNDLRAELKRMGKVKRYHPTQ